MLTMLPLPETKESTVVVIPADPSLVQALSLIHILTDSFLSCKVMLFFLHVFFLDLSA